MRYRVRVVMDVELGTEFRDDVKAAQHQLRQIPIGDYLAAAYTGVAIGGEMRFEPFENVAVVIEET